MVLDCSAYQSQSLVSEKPTSNACEKDGKLNITALENNQPAKQQTPIKEFVMYNSRSPQRTSKSPTTIKQQQEVSKRLIAFGKKVELKLEQKRHELMSK